MAARTRRLIIVEGPDLAGKSTLIQHWREMRESIATVHHGPMRELSTVGLATAYLQPIARRFYGPTAAAKWGAPNKYGTTLARGNTLVMDRSWFSEPIYRDALRDQSSRLDPIHMRMLNRVALAFNPVLVICLPPWPVIEARYKDRGDDFVKHLHVLKRVYDGYKKLAAQYPSALPQVIEYDHKQVSPQELLEIIDRGTGGTARSTKDNLLAGRFAPGCVLLVGEQPTKGARNSEVPAWPFVQVQKQQTGCSYWLTAKLERAGIAEGDLAWMNVRNDRGNELQSARFIERIKPKKVIAMGKVAGQWLTRHRINHVEVHHPQSWKRFFHNQQYPLIEEIRREL